MAPAEVDRAAALCAAAGAWLVLDNTYEHFVYQPEGGSGARLMCLLAGPPPLLRNAPRSVRLAACARPGGCSAHGTRQAGRARRPLPLSWPPLPSLPPLQARSGGITARRGPTSSTSSPSARRVNGRACLPGTRRWLQAGRRWQMLRLACCSAPQQQHSAPDTAGLWRDGLAQRWACIAHSPLPPRLPTPLVLVVHRPMA